MISMKKLLVEILYALPIPLRKFLKKIFRFAVKGTHYIDFFIHDFRIPVSRINRDRLCVVYIGHNSIDSDITKIFYGEVIEPEPVEFIWIWQIRGRVDRFYQNADILLVSLSPIFCQGFLRKVSFEIPNVVELVTDFSGFSDDILNEIKNTTNKDDIRKVRKYGYEYEISTNLEDLKYFYENCHRPFVQERHGRSVYVNPWREFKRYFEEGELLLVKRDGHIVSGGLCQVKNKEYEILYNGVYQADSQLLKEGALSAEYAFSIVEAKKKGCKGINFGISRPFLKDGILQYKKKWKTHLRKNPEINRAFKLWIRRFSPEAIFFLEDNPFIIREGGHFFGIVFFGEQNIYSEKEITAILKKYYIEGMKRLIIVCLNAQRETQLKSISKHTQIPFVVVSFLDIKSRKPEELLQLIYKAAK